MAGHRRKGDATLLVHDGIDWARPIDADRVDLSATPSGQYVYEGWQLKDCLVYLHASTTTAGQPAPTSPESIGISSGRRSGRSRT